MIPVLASMYCLFRELSFIPFLQDMVKANKALESIIPKQKTKCNPLQENTSIFLLYYVLSLISPGYCIYFMTLQLIAHLPLLTLLVFCIVQ